jgi:hypothetical protein
MYLTSGLLCFERPTPDQVLELRAWIDERCTPSNIYLVQLDRGGALAVAVEALVNSERQQADPTCFIDAAQLKGLAKKLKRRLWGGFAEGGYSNTQSAIAVSAQGKVRWRSSWSFDYSPRVAKVSSYPLATPDDSAELASLERSKKGYGRIGSELATDFFELLSIERGDPLTNVALLELKAGTPAKAVAKFLAHFTPPKPLPAPAAAEALFISVEGGATSVQERATMLAALIALACRERKLARLQLTSFGTADTAIVGVKGASAAQLSTIFQRDTFISFVFDRFAAAVRVMSVRKGKVIAANGRLSPTTQLEGGATFPLPADIEWESFPAFPSDALDGLAAGLRKYGLKRSREEGLPQVIMRPPSALFG